MGVGGGGHKQSAHLKRLLSQPNVSLEGDVCLVRAPPVLTMLMEKREVSLHHTTLGGANHDAHNTHTATPERREERR